MMMMISRYCNGFKDLLFEAMARCLEGQSHEFYCLRSVTGVMNYACITLPIRFLRSGDRRYRRLTGSMTVLTVRVFC